MGKIFYFILVFQSKSYITSLIRNSYLKYKLIDVKYLKFSIELPH